MAKIHITNRQFPLEVSDEKAKKIRDLWINEEPKNKISIDGTGWNGTYGQIKSFEISSEQKEKKISAPVFSEQDFADIDREIKKYLDEDGKLTMQKEFEFFRDKGIMRFDGEGKTASEFTVFINADRTEQYEFYRDLLDARGKRQTRYEFGKKKELEQLDQVAQQLTVSEPHETE